MVPAHSESFIINKVFFSTVIQNYILKVDNFAFFCRHDLIRKLHVLKNSNPDLAQLLLEQVCWTEGSMRKFGC